MTADGGTIGIAWPEVPATMPETAPVVLVLPGLCGDIKGNSHTVATLIAAACVRVRTRDVASHDVAAVQLIRMHRRLREALVRIERTWPSSVGTCFTLQRWHRVMVATSERRPAPNPNQPQP